MSFNLCYHTTSSVEMLAIAMRNTNFYGLTLFYEIFYEVFFDFNYLCCFKLNITIETAHQYVERWCV